MVVSREIEALLGEQKAYYEARSSEYDEWWERRGRYDLAPEGNERWREEIQKVEAAFGSVPLRGHILEPAGGTGNWTLYLARRATRVMVLDCSPSMIEFNRRRVREAGLLEVSTLRLKPPANSSCPVLFAFNSAPKLDPEIS